MDVAVIGCGYVGLVTATCLASIGHRVRGVEKDQKKLARLLEGHCPIFEPGLEELVKRNAREQRLAFTTSLAEAMQGTDVAFIAVGTPPGETGEADLSHVLAAAEQLGRHIRRYTVVVNKSTVPVGSAEKVAEVLKGVAGAEFDVVSNPEFLKEGSAIDDFMRPDRVVVGCSSERARAVMSEPFAPFVRVEQPILFMDARSAELTKYAANAMLALRISFINEIANLAESVGADVDHVKTAIGADHRIGPAFLNPGPGFGGSCFPKDLQALLKVGREYGQPMMTLATTVEANRHQKQVLLRKVKAHFGVVAGVPAPLKDRRFALWGLAFKANTDDIRESMALELIDGLVNLGAEVVVHDFAAMEAVKAKIGDKVRYAATPLEACAGADALLIATEWPQYREADLEAALSLAKIGPPAKGAVPSLVNALGQSDASNAPAVAYALGKIGPAAKEAGPALEKLRQREISGRRARSLIFSAGLRIFCRDCGASLWRRYGHTYPLPRSGCDGPAARQRPASLILSRR